MRSKYCKLNAFENPLKLPSLWGKWKMENEKRNMEMENWGMGID